MHKRIEYIFLVLILLLALFTRTYYWQEGKYGADVFYHYKVVEDSYAKGFLEVSNDHAFCYRGQQGGQVYGFYLLPYLLGKITSLDFAFYWLPVLFGLFGIIAAYLFVRTLTNGKIALLVGFFLSIYFAFISKSYPFNYRGENLVFPFLLLSLWLTYLALTSRRSSFFFTSLSGVISGCLTFLWTGAMLPQLILMACVGSLLLFSYFKKKLTTHQLALSGLLFTLQAITLYLFYFSFAYVGKSDLFPRLYYPFILLGLFFYLGALFLSLRKKSHYPLIGLFMLFIVVALFLLPYIKPFLGGFGSIQAPSGAIRSFELDRPQFFQVYLTLFILPFLSCIGLLFFFYPFDTKTAYLLPFLLASFYLFFSAIRYLYFAAFIIFFLAALPFRFSSRTYKFNFMPSLVLILVVFSLFFNFYYALPLAFQAGVLNPNFVMGYAYLREHAPKESCIIGAVERGATPEFFTKRSSYFPTLAHDPERTSLFYTYLLSSEKPSFNVSHAYLFITDTDLLNHQLYSYYLHLEPYNWSLNIYNIFENMYIDPSFKQIYIRNGTSIQIVNSQSISVPRYSFINGTLIHAPSGQGCFYIVDENSFYFEDSFCNTNLYKIVTGQELTYIERVYFKYGVAIYIILSSFGKK